MQSTYTSSRSIMTHAPEAIHLYSDKKKYLHFKITKQKYKLLINLIFICNVITVELPKCAVFWEILTFSLMEFCQCFSGKCSLNIHGWRPTALYNSRVQIICRYFLSSLTHRFGQLPCSYLIATSEAMYIHSNIVRVRINIVGM
jgi:hypothetical protein